MAAFKMLYVLALAVGVLVSATWGLETRCPVCGMDTNDFGYENKFFVVLKNGQKIQTCGMDPRKFKPYPDEKHTDTEYLAANMAEFIKKESECSAECPQCQNNLKDPMTGEPVTPANFRFVCLAKGQKIYFASDNSKTQYLSQVAKGPHFQVDQVKCDNVDCEDAMKIQKLSPAAQALH